MSTSSVTLNHRRIYILPTGRGLGFVLLTALLLLIAFVYNNNLAYLLSFLLASVFFVTILHSYKALAGLVIHKGRSKAVFAGEMAGFDLQIDNPVDTERRQLRITLQETLTVSVGPNSTLPVTLFSPTNKRGLHPAGTITVSSTFPLGLLRTWSPIRFDFNVLVYPKPGNLDLAFPTSPSAGASQGFSQKNGDDFYGLQEYRSGDSIRHIHWKTYAKGLGVFSKQYGGDSAPEEIRLDYDLTPGHDVEQRLSQLCRWVIDAERAGVNYGFALPGVKLESNRGSAHFRACLEALALF